MKTLMDPKSDFIPEILKRTVDRRILDSSIVALSFTSHYAYQHFSGLNPSHELALYLTYPLFFQQYTVESDGLYFIKTFITPHDTFEYIRDVGGNISFVFSEKASSDLTELGFRVFDSGRPAVTFYTLADEERFISVNPSKTEEIERLVYIANASNDVAILSNDKVVGGITHHGEFVSLHRPPKLIEPSYFVPTTNSKVFIFVKNGRIRAYSGDRALAEKFYNTLSGKKVLVVNVRETIKESDSVVVSNYDNFSL